MEGLQLDILKLLQNYALCSYPLNIHQIHRMTTVRVGWEELKKTLDSMQMAGLIEVQPEDHWYTTKGMADVFKTRRDRVKTSEEKQLILQRFVRKVQLCPWINTIMLTGSCALANASKSDDIDLMIITSPHAMFLCRLYAYFLAKFMGVARKHSVEHHPNAICINIWIDGSDLTVPTMKMSTYSAREIANAIMILDREGVFDAFIEQNAWAHRQLPNWAHSSGAPDCSQNIQANALLRLLNAIVGWAQLAYMRKRITNETVSMTQLWFHPRLRD